MNLRTPTLIISKLTGMAMTQDGEWVPRDDRRLRVWGQVEARQVVVQQFGEAWTAKVDLLSPTISEYKGFIGRLGGSKRSARKTTANRLNCLKNPFLKQTT